jgi:hypothetical protein
MMCYFFLCNLFCLPRQVCPRADAQNQLLRHLTQSRVGALNFMLKLWNFYKAHLRSSWAENWCASYLGDTKSGKISKNKSKIYKIWTSTSALTPWWALLRFLADRAVLFLSLWSTVPSQSDFPMGRGPNSNSKAPNSEPGWCSKFQAKTCGISIGHTFYPIELKIGVHPQVIQNDKKYQKNKSKKCKIWISTSGLTPWWAPLSFHADRVVLFLSL